MTILRIAASFADIVLLLISALSIIGNRLNDFERRAMLFCLLLSVANIICIWSSYATIL